MNAEKEKKGNSSDIKKDCVLHGKQQDQCFPYHKLYILGHAAKSLEPGLEPGTAASRSLSLCIWDTCSTR